MTSPDIRRSYELDCDEVARDVMDGRRVAVFCDGQDQAKRQAKRHKDGVAAAAWRAGAAKVVNPARDRRVDIDGHTPPPTCTTASLRSMPRSAQPTAS